ncbi:MAG: ABC transporter permease [Prolixibacteraceae bacterium]|jgi:putative ABC transport system permease protein|nr:ABC transporter permease [Bacteroidota bacterium]NLS99655.1 FtsX-like permease family protein [Bacteroidales bacterium]OQB81709.1 MAG: Macrolide export ATP-binding/permease protein MacB [Bacteroidetes bacterium ADurb.Bin123]HNZ67718.1 ABC transporter permease [Prolixibacteraceae bacterium]HOC85458.1 ABC transporter permease [Prolixibacteraceae bacterium]
MFDVDIWQEIISTIRKNKLRTFLTGFSVAWGIFMLMVLLGSGNGLQNGVREEFADNAVNIMWMWTGKTSLPYNGLKEGREIRFTNEDYDFLTIRAEDIDQVSSRFYLRGDITYSYGKEYGSFSTSTCHPSLLDIEKIKLTQGRFINDLDIKELRKVIVIGDEIRKALFKEEDPMGKYIKVGSVPFKVIGITLDPGTDRNRQAYMPFTTAQRLFAGGNRVHNFTVTTRMVSSVKEAEAIDQHVREQMARRHDFDPEDNSAMGSYNMLTDYIRTMKIFQAIRLFVWIIGIGTLIAGIVGVSNIMLILVKERTREIGIRKSLGASPASVIRLVLLESVLITTVAGYLGLVTGVGLMEAVNFGLEQMMAGGGGEQIFFRNPTVNFSTALTATAILIVSGALAGYIPARNAANVKPIEALRDE